MPIIAASTVSKIGLVRTMPDFSTTFGLLLGIGLAVIGFYKGCLSTSTRRRAGAGRAGPGAANRDPI